MFLFKIIILLLNLNCITKKANNKKTKLQQVFRQLSQNFDRKITI